MEADHFVKAQQFVQHTHRDQYPAIDPTQAALSQAGKVVVITGASQGLGERAFVPAFAKAGAKAIVLVARSADKLNALSETLAKEYPSVETLAVPTDIADPASVENLFEKVKAKYGHADVLVNNAGVFKAIGPVKDVDQKTWWEELTLNIRGTFLITQGFLKLLPTPETPAKIVTLTSGVAYQIFPGLSAYGISKLGVWEIMKYVAAEHPNVLAVSQHPGVVMTDMTIDSFKPVAKDTPELVGGVGVWLAAWEGPDRNFLNGRFVSSNWDVDDLVAKKEEILKGNLLEIDIVGTFGHEQFVKQA